ncbi:hypothetical protein DFJ74DRAFT_642358 [Hyaloraphidium curvatum]|nr:hypothetical protein DFJ74DRAFT_642358 [Hyaloraphidium curvatum]
MLTSDDDQRDARFERAEHAQFECAACHRFCFPHLDPRIVDVADCYHLLCGVCVDRALAGEGPSRSCPDCSARFSARDVKPLDHDIANWRLLLGTLHGCPLGCGYKGDVQNIEAHLLTCPKTRCDLCGITVAVPRTVEEHQQNACPRFRVQCKHAGCLASLPRETVETHDMFCDFKVVECRSPGCKHKCPRKDLKEHEKSAALEHVKLATGLLHKAENEVSRITSQMALKTEDNLRLTRQNATLAPMQAEVKRLSDLLKTSENTVGYLTEKMQNAERTRVDSQRVEAALRASLSAKDAEIARLLSSVKLHESDAKVKDAEIANQQAELDRISDELQRLRPPSVPAAIRADSSYSAIGSVEFSVPHGFGPPTGSQTADPNWSLCFPSKPILVGPIELLAHARVTHAGLGVGFGLADARVHHIKAVIAQSLLHSPSQHRVASTQVLHHSGSWIPDILHPATSGSIFDPGCPIISSSAENAEKHIVVSFHISTLRIVLKGSEGADAPSRTARLPRIAN